jgi:hypothetical protein
MMSHDEALAQYGAYFAGQLSRGEVRAFHAHISDCEDCRVRLRTMKAAAPRPGFTRGGEGGAEERLQGILRKNRVIMYAVLAVLICFFLMFRLKRG